ncbi:hypothetical protein V1514DRAFT_39417 [Lipomyces japonicus]|uniref:uncharacterized protein n=1 Tax=Lipomyces japonicus TaxID=56871 RepID=UPI0034CFBF1C
MLLSHVINNFTFSQRIRPSYYYTNLTKLSIGILAAVMCLSSVAASGPYIMTTDPNPQFRLYLDCLESANPGMLYNKAKDRTLEICLPPYGQIPDIPKDKLNRIKFCMQGIGSRFATFLCGCDDEDFVSSHPEDKDTFVVHAVDGSYSQMRPIPSLVNATGNTPNRTSMMVKRNGYFHMYVNDVAKD